MRKTIQCITLEELKKLYDDNVMFMEYSSDTLREAIRNFDDEEAEEARMGLLKSIILNDVFKEELAYRKVKMEVEAYGS